MVALKLCIILFLNLFLYVFCVKIPFKIDIEINCGNLLFSGDVQLCDPQKNHIQTWKLDRKPKIDVITSKMYEFKGERTYYWVYFRTDCGILTPHGSYCQNEFKMSFDVSNGYTFETKKINLLEEIHKTQHGFGTMVYKCDKELETFTCT
uniref:Uncharacterized protein n=1 Tax=Panagrolaimus davidi TaxID=227884 RepID=A0A914PC89_9BILA